jgi:hypothetical protein
MMMMINDGYKRFLYLLVGYLKTVSVARPHSVERIDDRLMMNWNGFGRKRSWSIRGTIAESSWRDRSKFRKPQSV